METPTESTGGYPEEQPAEVTPGNEQGDEPQRQGALPDEGGEHGEGGSPATESGDGHATGNPNS